MRDDDSETALMYAARNGHVEVVQLLLDVGVNKDIEDDNGQTALAKAVQHGHLELAKLLQEANPGCPDKSTRNGFASPFLFSKNVPHHKQRPFSNSLLKSCMTLSP